MKTVNLNAAYFPAVELLSALVTAGILIIGGIEAITGHTSTGVVFAFIAALNNFFDPIQQLSQLYTTYQSGMAALDKIFELLDEQPELIDAPDALELGRDPRRARASSTCHSATARRRRRLGAARHRSDDPARARRSRSSARPEPASRRSPSWSRASTTRRRGACWSTATTCATSPRLAALADGHRAQEAFLFSGTVRDNIAFGAPDATDEEIAPPPRAVGADDFIDALTTATTPRSASAASSSRPASAS